MTLSYFQIDAFTSRLFEGNPAGVCLLEEWLPDDTLQSLAAENNLPETAFLVQEEAGYRIRWFTPEMEMDLCGHATLAAGYVLYQHRNFSKKTLPLNSASGPLQVSRQGDLLFLDFPSRPPRRGPTPPELGKILGAEPRDVLSSRDLLAVYDSQETVASLSPDREALSRLDAFGVIVTAPGREADFVSRYFTPGAEILEDPVTGSAHCTLIPYWAEKRGKTRLFARQISRRGGELSCRLEGSRVVIGGQCRTYLSGQITL